MPVPTHAPPAVGLQDVTNGYVPWSRSRNVACAPSSSSASSRSSDSCSISTVSHTYGARRAPSSANCATTASTSSGSPPSAVISRLCATACTFTELAKARRVEHVAGAQADAARLVGVGRADALQRGADAVVAAALPRRAHRATGATGRSGGTGCSPSASRSRCRGSASVSISLNSVGRSTTTPLPMTGMMCGYSTPLGMSCSA